MRQGESPYPQAQIEQAITLYIQGSSPRTIQKQTGVGRTALSNCLHSRGIAIRSQSQAQRRYRLNERYFSHIDTREKAYWLGMLYADGCIIKHLIRGPRNEAGSFVYQVGIAFQDADVDHLKLFRRHLDSDAPVKPMKGLGAFQLRLTSRQMVEDLERKGCNYRKSLETRIPNASILPRHLLSHYVRGYLDGDGTVRIRSKKDGTQELFVHIACGADWARDLSSLLGYGSVHIVRESRANRRDYAKFGVCHGTALRFLTFVYSDSRGCRLERKFLKFQEWVKMRWRLQNLEATRPSRKRLAITTEHLRAAGLSIDPNAQPLTNGCT